MKKLLITNIFILLFVIGFSICALACTIFTTTDGKKTLFGNNEDWIDKDTYIWFMPAESGKYGRAFLGFENGHPQGGINDKGLCFDWVATSSYKLAPNTINKPDYPYDFNDIILEKCRDVDEVLKMIDKHNPSGFGYCELMIADKGGSSAVITWDWNKNKLNIERGNGRYQAIGYGEPAVMPLLEKVSVTIPNFKDMLKAARQGDLTVYSNIYDAVYGDIYIYNQHNFEQQVKLNLSTELKKGRRIIYIPSLFPEQKAGKNNELGSFKIYSYGQLLIIGIILLLFITAVIFFMCQVAKSLKLSDGLIGYHLANVLCSTFWITFLVIFFKWGPFIIKYGIGLLGFAVYLITWIAILLSIVQTAGSVLLWKKSNVGILIKIYYSVTLAVSLLMTSLVIANKMIM